MLSLGKHKDALSDFKQANKISPGTEAKEKLELCQKIIKKLAFEEAIGVEDEVPISKKINLNEISVDSSYVGPHLNLPITLSFVKEMIQTFKEQKKIHSK